MAYCLQVCGRRFVRTHTVEKNLHFEDNEIFLVSGTLINPVVLPFKLRKFFL